VGAGSLQGCVRIYLSFWFGSSLVCVLRVLWFFLWKLDLLFFGWGLLCQRFRECLDFLFQAEIVYKETIASIWLEQKTLAK
jgi:hypothetical protein